jgi:hypothetical protein
VGRSFYAADPLSSGSSRLKDGGRSIEADLDAAELSRKRSRGVIREARPIDGSVTPETVDT